MKSWDNLMNSALLGTGKGPGVFLESCPSEISGLLGAVQTSSEEEKLLVASGALAVWRRAGVRPVRLEPDGDAAAEQETLPPVGPSAASHLRMMLSGTHADVLPEWLDTVRQQGKRIPPELLPALLNHVTSRPDLKLLAIPVMGCRGAWLTRKNAEWACHSTGLEFDAWETGSGPERIEMLGRLHRSDPTRALSLLEAAWPTEAAGMRRQFIDAFQDSVGAGDEAWLERCLDDKSKEVRRSAVESLCRISQSALVLRMQSRAEALIDFKPARLLAKAKLDFRVPEKVDASMIRDGVETKAHTGTKKLGEKAAALMLILAATPPSCWTDKTGMNWDSLVASVEKSEWSLAIYSGWAMAAVRFHCPDLAVALMAQTQECYELVSFDLLVRSVPESVRSGWLIDMMEKKRWKLDSGDMLSALLGALDSFSGCWPDGLAVPVLRQLRSSVEGGKWSWSLIKAMPALAIHVPPAMLASAVLNWKPVEAVEPAVQKFLDILRFRQDVREALK
jgi:hypothetical protein